MKKRIIICGYPKSGNTWLTRLTAEIVECPVIGFWDDLSLKEEAIEGLDRVSEWECYKSHSCMKRLNVNENDKIIYVIRNPKDIIVSAYHYFYIKPRNECVHRLFKYLPFGLRVYNRFYNTEKFRINTVVKWLLYGTNEAPCLNIPWKEHVSGALKANILTLKYEDLIKSPVRETEKPLELLTVRSFNINPQNVTIDDLKGGVIGGSIMSGILKIGQKITLYPGLVVEKNSRLTYHPLKTEVLSICSDKTQLDFAVPGGLLGIQVNLDSALTAKNRLIGNFVIETGKRKINVYEEIEVSYRILGPEFVSKELRKRIKKDCSIIITAKSKNLNAKILEKKKKTMTIKILYQPLVGDIGDRLAISIDEGKKSGLHLVGQCVITSGIDAILETGKVDFHF